MKIVIMLLYRLHSSRDGKRLHQHAPQPGLEPSGAPAALTSLPVPTRHQLVRFSIGDDHWRLPHLLNFWLLGANDTLRTGCPFMQGSTGE